MDDRSYLRSLGFEVGERGRFSKDMVEELNARDKVETAEEKYKLPTQVPQREARQLLGYDDAGNTIAFVMCSRCGDHMRYCTCKRGVYAPRYITGSKDPLVHVPVTVLQYKFLKHSQL